MPENITPLYLALFGTLHSVYYTPGIQSMLRVYSFYFLIVRFLCMYVSQSVCQHLHLKFVLKFLRTYIFQVIWWIWFLFSMMMDIGLKFFPPLSSPLPLT